jgi:hypothetical protein
VDRDAAKPQAGQAHPHQPPPSTQPDSSGRPLKEEEVSPDARTAEEDSATAAKRVMKQTSKTEPETGSNS